MDADLRAALRAVAQGGTREPRRILMTTDAVGGAWQFTLDLCRGLAARGDRIALASMGAPLGSLQRREAEAIAGLHLHESAFALEWMDAPWHDIDAAGDWLLGIAAEFEPSVVHLNQFAFGHLPWPAPVLVTGHSCVLSWWRAVHGTDAPPEWREYQHRVQRGLRAAGLVVAPTRAMLSALELHYGPLSAARVIAHGRTLESSPGPKEEPLVLAAGRLWDAGRNLAELAAVARSLPWLVCIAGDDSHPGGGRTELPNVRLLGRLGDAELATWYARAPIYALPARYEPFGVPALEAALAGCALVLGDIPSLREVWGDAAVYVASGDRDGLRAALQGLIDDADLRERMAVRAHVRARRYTPDAMVRAYRRAYADLDIATAPLRHGQAQTARWLLAGARR